MLSFRQIQNCEGYYYNVTNGEILRNVGPGDSRCWNEGSWSETAATDVPEMPQFELLTADVLAPIQTVLEEAARRYGEITESVLNRQTARQPGGGVITEEAASLASEEPGEIDACRSST